MRIMRRDAVIVIASITLLLAAFDHVLADSVLRKEKLINHIIVIYQENWSFDGLYGRFPGANGLDNARSSARQVDKEGNVLNAVPRPLDTRTKPAVPDERFFF